MSLPLLGLLAESADVTVHVVANGYTARVFWGQDRVSDVCVLAKAGAARHVVMRAKTMRRLGCEGAVLLPPSFSGALALFLSGVRHRVGFATDARRLLLSRSLSSAGLREEHLSQSYLRLGAALLEMLGVPNGHGAHRPRLRVSDSERRSLRRVLDEARAPRSGFAVVVPGATYGPTKSWPLDKYRELAHSLSRELPVVLAGTARERDMCAAIADGAASIHNLAGHTSLGELFALLEEARVLVANDSGAPHVAGALGTPTVVIFGSTSPRWTKPLGEHVTVIREPVHCSPCFLATCPTQLECYAAIQPERVLEKTLEALHVEVNG